MITVSMKLPRSLAIAVSGGADSMACLDFLRASHSVIALHFNHGTPGADEAEALVRGYCSDHKIPLSVATLESEPPKGASLENFWREKRYEFFERERQGRKVVTCHHLDDVVETWIFTSLHGTPKLIPDIRGPYLRPFLQTPKEVFRSWIKRKGVPSFEDKSNKDVSFMRNYIRHNIIPHALEVNPGIRKVMRKKLVMRSVT